MAKDGSVRLTGLFPTRKTGMWTGTLRQAEMEQLADLLNTSLNNGKQVTAILFQNDQGKAEYTIYVGEARDRGFGGERGQPEEAPARGRATSTRVERPAAPARVERRSATRPPVQAEDPDRLPF